MQPLSEFLHENYVYPYRNEFPASDLELYNAYQRGEYPIEQLLKHFKRKYYELVNRSGTGFNLTIPQTQFLNNSAKHRSFVAGYSSGKTFVMVIAILRDLFIQKGKNVRIDVYAPTLDLLKQTSIPLILNELERVGYKDVLNKSDMFMEVPQFGRIYFKTLADPEKLVGYESMVSHVDELDTLTTDNARKCWDKITGRTRQRIEVPPDHPLYNDPKFVIDDEFDPSRRYRRNALSAYTTPEGYKFAYEQFSDTEGEVKAPTYSNPYVQPDYIDTLRAMYSEELVRAYIRGEYRNLTSGSAWYSFAREYNVTPTTELQPSEALLCGMDFNMENMALCVCVMRQGKLVVVDEFHHCLDTPEIITLLKDKYPRRKITVFPDASGSSRKSEDASKTDIQLLYQAGFNVIAPSKNPPVKDRWQSLNAAFKQKKIDVASNCEEVIRCLEQQTIDKKTALPDKKGKLDHMTDALGYIGYHFFAIDQTKVHTGRVTGV